MRRVLSRVRNIGVIAHIDAGKTTTTERMLYLCGASRANGTVDDGNTQMDYLQDERDRGITIQSAATTFNWDGAKKYPEHQFNLIDTPGHVDFTLEVERALRVLDGAVTIFDAVAGVEAQTMTVWRQASRYNIPSIGFVNKMDRAGASFSKCCKMIEEKLGITALAIHHPLNEGNEFRSVLDVLNGTVLEWNSSTPDGTMDIVPMDQAQGYGIDLKDTLLNLQLELTDKLTAIDEPLMEHVLENDLMETPPDVSELKAALRRVTMSREGMPLLCGAARRFKGVEPLLDSVIDFLPSPLDRPEAQLVPRNTVINPQDYALLASGHMDASKDIISLPPLDEGPLCALAFKVTHDRHRGPLVFIKVYSGVLNTRQVVYNTGTQGKERITRVLRVRADDLEEIDEISAGNIAALVGTKHTASGDTLVCHRDHAHLQDYKMAGVTVPEPVFSCSIRWEGVDQKDVDYALACIQREDPSVRVRVDEETNQTILSGMGELHLEIVISRIEQEFKVPLIPGRMKVAYHERVPQPAQVRHHLHREMGDTVQDVEVQVEVVPAEGQGRVPPEIDGAVRAHYPDDERGLGMINAILAGVEQGADRGVELRMPLVDTLVRVVSISHDVETSASAVTTCVAEACRKAIKAATTEVLQPVMSLEVAVEDRDVGGVLTDISSERRGRVREVEMKSELERNVVAEVPLATMIGYASALRSVTSGRGNFSMEFSHYALVTTSELETIKAQQAQTD
eukprot:m.15368 g.15368  ORF g.15368 m.15368 type:complete len:738 (-) comp6589_c0_seq2:77-2290(-)